MRAFITQNLLRQFFVLFDHALDAPVNGALNEGAHLEQLGFEFFQFLFKVTHVFLNPAVNESTKPAGDVIFRFLLLGF